MAKAIKDIDKSDPNFLDCRDLGHQWDRTHDDVTYGARKTVVEFTRNTVCQRCHCTRREVFEVPSFRRKSVSMWYPDGYLVEGRGRVFKREVRRAVLRQMGLKVADR